MQSPPSESSQSGTGEWPASFLPARYPRECEWKWQDRRRDKQEMESTALSPEQTWEAKDKAALRKLLKVQVSVSQRMVMILAKIEITEEKSSWEGRCQGQFGTYLLNLVRHLCKMALSEAFIHLGRKKKGCLESSDTHSTEERKMRWESMKALVEGASFWPDVRSAETVGSLGLSTPRSELAHHCVSLLITLSVLKVRETSNLTAPKTRSEVCASVGRGGCTCGKLCSEMPDSST